MTLPRPLRPLALSLPLLLLVACGDDGTSAPTGDDAPPAASGPGGSAANVFAESDAFTERFGTRTARDDDADVDPATLDALVAALNGFSLELHRAAAGADPDAGTVSSGYGAATAFSLALAGTANDTRAALANLLGVDAIDEDDVHAGMNAVARALESRSNDELVLRTANRAFVRPGLPLSDAYLDVAVGRYGAPVTEADFANAPDEVARAVNAWASRETDGFIDSIVDGLPPTTAFALLNAIFLDAGWADEWSETAPLDFAAPGGTAPVPAFGGRARLDIVEADGVRGAELAYAGGELAMLILVPDDLAAFEAALDASALDALVDGLAPGDVRLRAPKWTEDASLALGPLLGPLGLPASPWVFGRMIDDPARAAVDVTALQRARIEVDENGTRAAAVTGVIAVTSAQPGEPVAFDVDAPFVYVLRDRVTGTVLFTGRVLDPGA